MISAVHVLHFALGLPCRTRVSFCGDPRAREAEITPKTNKNKQQIWANIFTLQDHSKSSSALHTTGGVWCITG